MIRESNWDYRIDALAPVQVKSKINISKSCRKPSELSYNRDILEFDIQEIDAYSYSKLSRISSILSFSKDTEFERKWRSSNFFKEHIQSNEVNDYFALNYLELSHFIFLGIGKKNFHFISVIAFTFKQVSYYINMASHALKVFTLCVYE